MVTLTVGNSYSKLEGLKTAEFNALRKILSYESDPQAAYFSGGFSRPKYLIDKYGSFPTGLLARVKAFLLVKEIPCTLVATLFEPRPPGSYLIKGVTPYPAQNAACIAAVKAHRGIISMPTGSGKSLVIALIASRLNVKTLVVVPSIEIKKQLREALRGFLGPKHRVTVENADSKILENDTAYDCLIIDEAHHVAAATYQRLNKQRWHGIYYRFFLTATPFRNQAQEQLLFEGIAGQLIYQLTYKEAVEKGYIVPVEAYYVDCPKQPTEGYTYAQVYSELVTNNEPRNQLIASLLEGLSQSATLCLVKEIKHGEELAALTGIPFANGKDEESRAYIELFNKGKIKQLLGTEGILSEGVDTKPCEYVVICGLGKAKSSFMQKVGRTVRVYPGKTSGKVVIFRDPSHKWTLKHYKEQVKILKDEYGIQTIKLDV